jgi:ribonuclease Z
MRVVFLGTGASWATTERNTASLAVDLEDQTLLLDCGEGTQRQLARADISLDSIDHVFLTHLHGDHVLGLPGLIWAMEHAAGIEELTVYGPPGVRGIAGRLTQLIQPAPDLPTRVIELGHRQRVSLDHFDVITCRLEHTDPNLGYAFVDPDDENTRPLVYTGDCRPDARTVGLAEGADVLVHDATFAGDAAMANRRGHSTARQAAEIAREAGVGELYLTTHLGPLPRREPARGGSTDGFRGGPRSRGSDDGRGLRIDTVPYVFGGRKVQLGSL